jgi:hypothetical protein
LLLVHEAVLRKFSILNLNLIILHWVTACQDCGGLLLRSARHYLVKKAKEPSRPQSQNLTESTHLHGASEKGRADLLRRKKSLGTKDE